MHFWSPRVTFNDTLTVYRYEPIPLDIALDPMQLSRDRVRREPRFIQPKTCMASVEYLLRETCKKYPITIVYGNLGRYPHLILYFLDLCYGPDERVVIYPASSYAILNLKGDLGNYADDGTRCDVLIYLEPPFGTVIDSSVIKPPYAKQVIILTSHMNFEWVDSNDVVFEPEMSLQKNPSIPTPQNIQVVHHFVGRILERFYPTVSAYLESPPDDADLDTIIRPPLVPCSQTPPCLEDFAQMNYLCIDVTRQPDRNPFSEDVGIQEACSENYLKIANVCDVMRYSGFNGKWNIVMESGIRNHFVEQLKSTRAKFKNLNGLYKNYYMDPFVIPSCDNGESGGKINDIG